MTTLTKNQIEFIKSIAEDYGHNITDEEAEKAHKVISEEYSKQDYYYGMKEYFCC